MTVFGFLNVNKPSGMTSRRVVDVVERLVRPAKAGHAGTLDPLASGVLVVGLGQATRLIEYVHELPKQYRATFLLGRTSTTEDIEGDVTELVGAGVPSGEAIKRAAAELVGKIMQRPPAFSALKVAGKRAYALARAGQTPELAPREIEIHRLNVLGYEYPELVLEVECSTGTYVRSLGRDLAERAGSAAVMSALTRTTIGPFLLEGSVDLAQLSRENLPGFLQPPGLVMERLMPVRTLAEPDLQNLAQGRAVFLLEEPASRIAAVRADGSLAAVLERREAHQFAPLKCFSSQ